MGGSDKYGSKEDCLHQPTVPACASLAADPHNCCQSLVALPAVSTLPVTAATPTTRVQLNPSTHLQHLPLLLHLRGLPCV